MLEATKITREIFKTYIWNIFTILQSLVKNEEYKDEQKEEDPSFEIQVSTRK